MQTSSVKNVMDTPATPEDLFKLLELLGISYELHHHDPIFTVAEGEHLKKSIPGLHCRNPFLYDKKEVMFLVVVRNDTKVDLKTLPEKLNSGRLSFCSPERLWRHLGIRPGSVCPFCIINDTGKNVRIVLDKAMMQEKLVCYHPLDNAMTIGLSPEDLLRFTQHTGHEPLILDFGT